MKYKVGDNVKVMSGKDKGKTGSIAAVLPERDAVVVTGMNMYTRHVKPMQGRAGERVRAERPLATAKIAIINDKGQVDRVGYQVAKDGQKVRVYKKTGAVITEAAKTAKAVKQAVAKPKKAAKK